MFILDDMILQQMGISIPGINLIWTLEQIRDFAFRELYNPEKIKSQVKENRLLFEFGERGKEEYEKKNDELMRKLKLAQRAVEMNLSVRTDILGAK